MRYDESAVIGVLGGGYGEPPVRVAELEEAARRRSAARRATHPVPPPAPDPGVPPDPDPDRAPEPTPDPQPGPP
ncbi:hypothetical protein AB0B31_37415 [Catellatospora citrea]|uniref:hypothetical protein n=1 Tax=Catellatospora citrea TaxID=53366 RepID=UPI0033E180FE